MTYVDLVKKNSILVAIFRDTLLGYRYYTQVDSQIAKDSQFDFFDYFGYLAICIYTNQR